MHIGMIGGIGPAATELYYRGLIARAKTRGVALELTIVHADIETLVSNMRAGDAGAQVAVYADLARRLQGAGADQLVISSIAGHFCLAEFAPVSPLPIVSMIDAMTARLRAMGVSRVGLLGTEVVMETGFYGGLSGLEVLVPGGAMFRQVDRHYLDMAMAGAADQADRDVFFSAGRDLAARGAEMVLLAGTDMFLAFEGQMPGFPTLDCAEVHMDVIADLAAGAKA